MILIDIVNLSQINQSNSYAYDDKVLPFCFSQLASISRIDDTVFGIGNRQFVCILPAIKTPSFVTLAMNKIVKVLQSENGQINRIVKLDIKIGAALNKSSEHAADKTLQIAETSLKKAKAGFDNLSKLKAFGVERSIDDFGTGYSSLSYFTHIPANELKIDQSFIRDMLENRQDQQIVKIIIEIAKFFNLKLVAEDIEDQKTYNYLKKSGCDYGQGYHMARPMPADEFIPLIKNRNR
ncbi:MAG: diguanylate cyclase (GGDEF)-like protein [Oceanicoccus sp.]